MRKIAGRIETTDVATRIQANSPRISHDRDSGKPLAIRLQIVRERLYTYRLFLCHQNPDYALISRSRPLSMPDRKSSLEKGGGDKSRASCDVRVGEGGFRFAKSRIISPDRDSKPTNSRTVFPTFNHRGKRRDRKSPDKPIIHPYKRKKPETTPGQKHPREKIQADWSKAPATREWSKASRTISKPRQSESRSQCP